MDGFAGGLYPAGMPVHPHGWSRVPAHADEPALQTGSHPRRPARRLQPESVVRPLSLATTSGAGPLVAERADRAGRAGRCRPEEPGGRPRVTVVALVEKILMIEPKRRKSQPFIRSYTVSHEPALAAYALQGPPFPVFESNTVTVSLLNYTGSTGFGDFYVQMSAGRRTWGAPPGEAIRHDGGFLTAPSIACPGAHSQYSDTFTAAVLRNPIISSQPASTYISEFGVRSPVLLLLGTEDHRVVNVRGEALFYALLALGRAVESRRDTPLDGV
ncbi:hypothetical protein EDB85DRAFT_2291621 [Lactarius pseudohatsudake]|nr:hypothetical protein EDB85DRAFT_2291621 [Lactarius pseudohatsudake]